MGTIKIFNESGQRISSIPNDGSGYREETWRGEQLIAIVEGQSFTVKQQLEIKSQEERTWRDSEIKLVSELRQESDHPYLVEINAYLQLLRDYPSGADFPNGVRPARPVTSSGTQIILTTAA